MGFLEKTGKNVDEALEQALNELKTTRDKVNIEVIEEVKNGLFGLFSKKAKIRVTLKDAAAKIGDVVEEALDNIKIAWSRYGDTDRQTRTDFGCSAISD